jgi:hypothetical protein
LELSGLSASAFKRIMHGKHVFAYNAAMPGIRFEICSASAVRTAAEHAPPPAVPRKLQIDPHVRRFVRAGT